jgi:hypothetical protein
MQGFQAYFEILLATKQYYMCQPRHGLASKGGDQMLGQKKMDSHLI